MLPLPPEILLLIFDILFSQDIRDYLRCKQVCHAWNEFLKPRKVEEIKDIRETKSYFERLLHARPWGVSYCDPPRSRIAELNKQPTVILSMVQRVGDALKFVDEEN